MKTIVFKGGKIVNVFTKELMEGDVAVRDGKILGIGDYEGDETVDCTGRYISPGFINAHLHIESSMSLPSTFAQVVLQFGTTTLIADPHEIANVCGIKGIEYMIEDSAQTKATIMFMLPSCVPATNMEDSGAILRASDLLKLKSGNRVLGLGEMMNYPGVLSGDESVHEKLKAFSDTVIDGHAPGLLGKELNEYAYYGIKTDHECSTIEEVTERLRAGVAVLIRKGSCVNNLKGIVPELAKKGISYDLCAFCTDDKQLEDIYKDGDISANIRDSIGYGLDVMEAYRMATYNPARIYCLHNKGAIGPGYDADLVVLDSLEDVKIHSVYAGGVLIGKPTIQNCRIDQQIFHSVNMDRVSDKDLEISLTDAPANIIEIIENQILTKHIRERVPTVGGFFKPDHVYSKFAVFERHHNTGKRGLGIVKNFNIRDGAIAQTIAHDSHNVMCIGDNDRDMVLAINTLIDQQGGIAVASGGKIIGTVELPVGGLMSPLPADELVQKISSVLGAAHALEINDRIEPFLTLGFLSLPVIPEIKLTDRGLFDVNEFRYISIQE